MINKSSMAGNKQAAIRRQLEARKAEELQKEEETVISDEEV